MDIYSVNFLGAKSDEYKVLQHVQLLWYSVHKKSAILLLPSLSALCLLLLTFKHFHSHCGVTSLSFETESSRLDNFPKLPFS